MFWWATEILFQTSSLPLQMGKCLYLDWQVGLRCRFWQWRVRLCNTPLLKKLNRARNDLSGKVIPLFKTYQDWEKKIIFEPFDQENLAGQPTILVRLNWPFFTPICQKAWQANYFIRAHRLKIHIKCSEFGFVAQDESNGISWFAKFSKKKKYFFVF